MNSQKQEMACFRSESDTVEGRVDELERLMFVEGGRGGFKPELLLAKMTNVEAEMLVCNFCNGILWEACITAEANKTGCRDCIGGAETSSIPWEKGRRLVEGLACRCPLEVRGCGWTGPLRELSGHWDQCVKRKLECPLNCKQVIAQDTIPTHMQRYCPNRTVTCQFCSKTLQARVIPNHEANVCAEAPTTCPNGCGYQVPKKSLANHLQSECSHVGVPCPFKEFGCEGSVKRGEVELHLSTSCPQHLMQLMQQLKKMTWKHEEAMRRIEGLERERTIMKRQLETKRKVLYERISSEESDDAMT